MVLPNLARPFRLFPCETFGAKYSLYNYKAQNEYCQLMCCALDALFNPCAWLIHVYFLRSASKNSVFRILGHQNALWYSILSLSCA